jgi:hypothetical protein
MPRQCDGQFYAILVFIDLHVSRDTGVFQNQHGVANGIVKQLQILNGTLKACLSPFHDGSNGWWKRLYLVLG